jgi:UrcA family protein
VNYTKMIAAIALAATAATAQAETAQMRVRVGDLDLKTEAGAEQALSRIKLAARDFCAIPLEIPLTPAYGRCRRKLTAMGVRQLDAPMVTALANPPQAVQVATH